MLMVVLESGLDRVRVAERSRSVWFVMVTLTGQSLDGDVVMLAGSILEVYKEYRDRSARKRSNTASSTDEKRSEVVKSCCWEAC